MLIGSDVKLNSPSSLISQALAEILQYPDKARDALRVLLHLVRDAQSIRTCSESYHTPNVTTTKAVCFCSVQAAWMFILDTGVKLQSSVSRTCHYS